MRLLILTDKAGAKWTRFKQRGFVLMVGTIAETGQVIAVELRHGNVAPNFDNLGFIKTCQALLPSGVILTRVRIDAAGYQHGNRQISSSSGDRVCYSYADLPVNSARRLLVCRRQIGNRCD